MALRDQPYMPLYVKDFLTDEKLAMCSAATTGVYIRLMCVMHKSDPYGTILLKQKNKQTGKHISDFALLVARSLPYDLLTVENAITELVEEGVLKIEGDYLIQKRMVSDNDISVKRSLSGRSGGKKTQSKIREELNFALPSDKANAQAKSEANTVSAIANENAIGNVSDSGIEGVGEKPNPEISSNHPAPPSPVQTSEPIPAVVVIPPPTKPKREQKSSTGTVAQNPPELLVVQCYWAEWTVYAKQPRKNWTKDIAFMLAEDWYDSMQGKGWKVGKAPGTPMKDWQAASRTGIKNAEEWGKVENAVKTLSGQSTQQANGTKFTSNNREAERINGLQNLREKSLAIVRNSGQELASDQVAG